MARALRDSVVVITGASSGIGRAAALAFAHRGANLVLAARRGAVLQDVASECDHVGVRAIACPTDVTDEAAVRALAARAVEEFGHIDVWVNDAAVTLFGRFEETPLDAVRRVLDTNVMGYVHGARAALPVFREQGHGVLINVASAASRLAQPFTSAYAMSQHAVAALSESLRQELLDAPAITVSTVFPASVDTPLFQHAANYTGRTPRPMSPVYAPEAVADAIVACAASPRAEVVVGTTGRALGAMRTVAPGLAERLVTRRVRRLHFLDRPAQASPGNLFQPIDHGTGVHGGWRRREVDGAGRTLATVALAALGLGTLGWLAWRAHGERLGGGSWQDDVRAAARAAVDRVRTATA